MTCRLDLIKERAEEDEDLYEATEAIEVTDDLGLGLPGDIGDPAPDDPVDNSLLRGEKDVVISGPVSTYKGHGRRFNTAVEALHWAQDKYGFDRVSLVQQPEGAPRWAVLVKNLRT